MHTLFTDVNILFKTTGNTQKDITSVTSAQEAATEICVKNKNKVIHKVVTTLKAAVFISNKNGTSQPIPFSSCKKKFLFEIPCLVCDFFLTQCIYKKHKQETCAIRVQGNCFYCNILKQNQCQSVPF